MEPIEHIEMINGWCNDYFAYGFGIDPVDLIRTIQNKTQEFLDKQPLDRFLTNCLIDAVNTSGSYNPDDNMYMFEEKLTGEECGKLHEFLTWVHLKNKGFGSANIDNVYAEYLTSTAKEV